MFDNSAPARPITKPPALPIAGLKVTLAALEKQLSDREYWAGYHQDELTKERMLVVSLTEQVAALRSTIALLEKV